MSPTVCPPVPLATTPWELEPEAQRREGAIPIQVNHSVWDTLWGLGIIIVATAMPLRATGDYCLDGLE